MEIFMPPRPPVVSPIALEGVRPGTAFLVHLESIQLPLPPPQVTVSSAARRRHNVPLITKLANTTAVKLCFMTPPLTLRNPYQAIAKRHMPNTWIARRNKAIRKYRSQTVRDSDCSL